MKRGNARTNPAQTNPAEDPRPSMGCAPSEEARAGPEREFLDNGGMLAKDALVGRVTTRSTEFRYVCSNSVRTDFF